MTPAPLDFSPVRYPTFAFLPNGRTVRLCSDIEYRGSRHTWRTRRGLITDGASIPLFLVWIIGGPFEGRHRRAAVLHDAYYLRLARTSRTVWRAIVSPRRSVVDHMLFEVAAADGTHPVKCLALWFGVRVGGWWAWRKHALARQRRLAVIHPAAVEINEPPEILPP